jgi:serine/threonine-protein phosphatase PP1 catalytic subunit
MCDLVWADPEEKLKGWTMNSRGISLSFDAVQAERFCQRFNIDLVVRGHQLTKEVKLL